jgi:hypothetical protein
MHDFIGCIRTSYCYDVVSWLTHGLIGSLVCMISDNLSLYKVNRLRLASL